MKRAIVSCGVVTLVLAAAVCTSLGLGAAAAPNKSPWRGNYFPNVSLVTQDGKTVRFYDDLLKDKIVVINFIYTHCKDACPLETARLAQVQRLLGDRVGRDIFFYSISIDPNADTPEVLKDYAERYHAGPGWLFLTGKKDEITLLARKLGMDYNPDPDNRDGHAPFVMIGNEATGQWMRNSATDNPRLLAVMIGDWMSSWQKTKPGTSYEEVSKVQIPDKGKYLFQQRCAACHTVGKGDLVGPDLEGVTDRRERKWLTRFVAVPDAVLAEGDPTAKALYAKYKQVQMPNLRLAAGDVEALLDYLENSQHQHHHHHEAGSAASTTN